MIINGICKMKAVAKPLPNRCQTVVFFGVGGGKCPELATRGFVVFFWQHVSC